MMVTTQPGALSRHDHPPDFQNCLPGTVAHPRKSHPAATDPTGIANLCTSASRTVPRSCDQENHEQPSCTAT